VEATVERRIDRVVALAIDLFSSVSLPVATSMAKALMSSC
jgi:hypothetical protein